jgi:hypothetical protein
VRAQEILGGVSKKLTEWTLHGHCMSFHITAVSSGIFSSKFWKTQRFSLVLSALPMSPLEFTRVYEKHIKTPYSTPIASS